MSKTIRDFAEGAFKDPSTKQTFFVSTTQRTEPISIEPNNQSFWETQDQNIQTYNENLLNLDHDYMKSIPIKGVLVRMYHLVATKTKSGVIIAPEIPMKEITQNGIGIRKTLASPWAYSTKGVVVSTPEYNVGLKPGDIVQVVKEAVVAIKPSVDHPPHMPFSYFLPEWIDFEPPTDPSHKHFGYLLLDPLNQIVSKIVD